MSFVKPVTGITFSANRLGYFYALSARESSSNLNLPDYDPRNIKAQSNSNYAGYIGYFQFGESQLYEAGYFSISEPFSIKRGSAFQKAINVNDWKGVWTGKNGVKSKQQFLTGRRWQLDAIDFMHNLHCKRLRALGYNEFYGKIVKGVEITESGCCAGVHLVGLDAVKDFALGKGDKTDGTGTPVSHYIGLFAFYDMESCCNRKIYIQVVKDKQPVESKQITVETEYDGKFHVGKLTNTYTTNAEGKIPVIVRHPGAKIKITVDGKSREIVQEADRKQSYIIDLTDGVTVIASLEKPSNPQPKPKSNQTLQEARNEQNSQSDKPSDNENQDVNFNIIMIEGDTKKPITNLKFFVTYKGKAKDKRTDNTGAVKGLVATAGQDIEISMQGDNTLQPIHHFKASKELEGKNLEVPLPVEGFIIKVVNHKSEPVKNTNFMLKYRGRSITKKTDNNGNINTKMLVGFVYKFCLANGQELITRRFLKGSTEKISINEVAYNLSQGRSTQSKTNQETSFIDTVFSFVKDNIPSFSLPPPTIVDKPSQPVKSSQVQKPSTTKPVAKAKPPAVKQNNTHTEKNGNPLTVVTNKSTSSDRNLDGIAIVFSIPDSRRAEVSQKTLDTLKRLAKLAGRTKLVITSARRTPLEQANAMYGNIRNGNVIRYAKPGLEVTNIAHNGIRQGLSKEQIIKNMVEKIDFYDRQGIRVSRHCVSSATYATRNIVDLGNGSNGFSGAAARIFHNCCKQAVREGWITRVISPLDDTAEPAFHIEIVQ